MRWPVLFVWITACAAEIEGGGPGFPAKAEMDAAWADSALPVALTILQPEAGALFVRDQLGADGAMVAPIEFRARASGKVATVEWLAEGTLSLGTGRAPEFMMIYPYHGDGDRWVDAVGRDEAGVEVARTRVSFSVSPGVPVVGDCQGLLAALGVEFVSGPETEGVPDPVTVTLPVFSIAYRYVESSSQRRKLLMDCELALALHRAAAVFTSHDVIEVADYGVYSYRCINQSVEPPCPGSKLSMHAYAQAIDIAGLTTASGEYYSLEDDWVIDPESDETCEAGTSNPRDTFLHTVVCDLYRMGVFNVYLTPNFNAAHRDHWHLDLTPRSDFIERRRPEDDR